MLLPNAEPFVCQEINNELKYPIAEFCGLVRSNEEDDCNVKDCCVSTEPLQSSASFFSWEELTGEEKPDEVVNEKETQTDQSMSEKLGFELYLNRFHAVTAKIFTYTNIDFKWKL